MGQAKLRGSFEERKQESLFYESERKRLDDWLEARQPEWLLKRRKARPSTLALLTAAMALSAPPYLRDLYNG